jgi:large subunit ribosomal protein L6
MSRVGKKPILIPQGVEVKVEGQNVLVKGPKGELNFEVRREIGIEIKDNNVIVFPQKQIKKVAALWGTTRAIIANMVKGVVSGYEEKLEVIGIGFKAKMEGGTLVLEVGFSHPIKIEKPENINFTIEKNIITITGINKELVGQIAAKIRKVKVPEPYKGTGIKYIDEIIKKKAGKKVTTAGG